MIDFTIEEKISHENISLGDLNKLQESSGRLEYMANNEQMTNQTHRVILEELTYATNFLTRYPLKINEDYLQKFENFLNRSLFINSFLKKQIDDFQLQIKIVGWLNDKLLELVQKSSNPVQSKNSCENFELNDQKDKTKIQKEIDLTPITKDDSSLFGKFFYIACEIFSTRKTIGILCVKLD